MQKTGGYKRLVRVLGLGILVASVIRGMGSFASTSTADEPTSDTAATQDTPVVTDTLPQASVQAAAAGDTPPFGPGFPGDPGN